MVKCSRCGVEIDDSFEICPNCGNNLAVSNEKTSNESNEMTCDNCGASLKDNADFCSECGTKVGSTDSNRCSGCGSEIPDGVLFCPTCGTKVEQKPELNRCSNCGFELEDDATFCPECGINVQTGTKPENVPSSAADASKNMSFVDKINFNKIIKPTIVSLIAAVILSVIGVLIGFSWLSFLIAILLSVGFFAGFIDNEANAVISGFFTGLILGVLENPIVAFCWGVFAAKFYEWFFGGQILLLIIFGVIIAYVSNMYLKSKIQNVAGNLSSWF